MHLFSRPVLAVACLASSAGVARAQLPPVPVPSENPITEEKRVLGKILFWEEQLSSTNTMACGTCHITGSASSDPRQGAHPGPDGVWEATVYGNQDGSLLSRMMRPNPSLNTLSNIDRGKVFGPYLELKDDHLLASTDGRINAAGQLNLFFPGDGAYDPLLPKVIVDYWGHPIRYYRRLYAPGSLKSPYRPHGRDTRPPTLSDVFVLRPFEIKPGNAIDGRLGDLSAASYLPGNGDTTTIAALNSAEFALFSSGPDGLINPDIRYDNPDDPGNNPYGNGPTSFVNEDNIVELGP